MPKDSPFMPTNPPFYTETCALYTDGSAPPVFFVFFIITISYSFRKPFIYAVFMDFQRRFC